MRAKEYQDFVYEKLRGLHSDLVEKEWSINKNSQDSFPSDIYCPRIDVVIEIGGHNTYFSRIKYCVP